MLKEVYSDGKYNPGDNFVEVDKESCNECLDIMYDVVEAVNAIRTTLDLPIKSFDRKMLCIQPKM